MSKFKEGQDVFIILDGNEACKVSFNRYIDNGRCLLSPRYGTSFRGLQLYFEWETFYLYESYGEAITHVY